MVDRERTRPEAAEVWAVVRAERIALVDDLWPLASHRWAVPSLCPGWDVHDVVAHLVHDARTDRIGFVRDLVRARLDVDRANAAAVARVRDDHPLVTLVALEAYSHPGAGPPVPLAVHLVEVLVHGEDVRRPLGLVRDLPLAAVVVALAHQARTSARFDGGRGRAAGFRLVATDADLMTGDGPEVRGSALALLLALSGRPTRPGEITGPGASAFLG